MNKTIEAYTTWLEKSLLSVINMKNGVVQHKNKMKYIYTKYKVRYITPHLNLHGIKKAQNSLTKKIWM